MGLTYAKLCLTRETGICTENRPCAPRPLSVEVRALVDTGALFMCVPQSVASQLGFDITEVRQRLVRLTDGSAKSVPVIAPITIEFENRWYTTEALVLGDEPLMGGRVENCQTATLPHQTVHAIFSHTAFRCSSHRGMR